MHCDLALAQDRGWEDGQFGAIDTFTRLHMVAHITHTAQTQTNLSLRHVSGSFISRTHEQTPPHSLCNLQSPCLDGIPALTWLHLRTLTSQPFTRAKTRRPRLQTTAHTSKNSKVECHCRNVNIPTHICIYVHTQKNAVCMNINMHTHTCIYVHTHTNLCQYTYT